MSEAVSRDEVLIMMGALADIVVDVRKIKAAIIDEDEDEENQDDEG
jgi:hypothetical protein